MKTLRFLLAVAALLALSPLAAADYSTPLYANYPNLGEAGRIGTVQVGNDATNLYVTFTVDAPAWALLDTHLYAGKHAPKKHVLKKHAPGSFPYEHENLEFARDDRYTIPLAELGVRAGDTLYLASYATSAEFLGFPLADLDGLAGALPTAPVHIQVSSGGPDSYFNTFVDNAGSFNGTRDGWCIDTDHGIYFGALYKNVQALSSYSSAVHSEALVEQPDNMDLLNYVLNQDYVGRVSPSSGVYTYSDVQRAIWALVDLYSPSTVRAAEIFADAYTYGEGFVPACNGVAAVILKPMDSSGNIIAQITVVQTDLTTLGLACEPEFEVETAWGFGTYAFPKVWGWYSSYTVQ